MQRTVQLNYIFILVHIRLREGRLYYNFRKYIQNTFTIFNRVLFRKKKK
jgi:hypothetical protein